MALELFVEERAMDPVLRSAGDRAVRHALRGTAEVYGTDWIIAQCKRRDVVVSTEEAYESLAVAWEAQNRALQLDEPRKSGSLSRGLGMAL